MILSLGRTAVRARVLAMYIKRKDTTKVSYLVTLITRNYKRRISVPVDDTNNVKNNNAS